ncbi:hypothetical protein AYO39_00130 [Actinobacteria bacterium SCGC AG-212-D09]|nr:hypothetical protein AYO39_00130 [Actinobacteria bacterium SCGC AG-212-D09]
MSGRITLLLIAVALAGSASASAAQTRAPARPAVVLVSGLSSASPFSTPARSCVGKQGPAWALKNGIPPALERAGYRVFTAPVRKNASTPPPAPCASPAPGSTTWINSGGEVDANGAALDRFLAFLHRSYKVNRVILVGHSDGGLWSRSTISTHRSFPTIVGLVTLGTPYTGSPVADLGGIVSTLNCPSSAPACALAQRLVSGILDKLGRPAVTELSSAFLETWNQHPKLTGCRVTAIQGTAIRPAALPASQPALSGYYVPTDGLVGRSSGADRRASALDGSVIPAAPILRLVDGGAFPVYHTPQIGNPSELNDPPINAAIVRALRQPASPCGGGRQRQPSRLTVRLVTVRETRGGSLGRAAKGDIVFAPPRPVVSCGSSTYVGSPLLPTQLLKTYVTGSCAALRSTGAAMLLHNTSSTARLTLSGGALTVAVGGPRLRSLAVQVLQGRTWSPVALRGGRATVPRANLVQLRLLGTTQAGADVSAWAPMNG